MEYATLQLKEIPQLSSPAMIIGFGGMGNALEVSTAMATYLVDQHHGRLIGGIDSDACYRYDENRPVVKIENGAIKAIQSPGGNLFAVQTGDGQKDLLILIADEPSVNWRCFSSEVADLAVNLGVAAVFTLGSMFDHVLHTDRIISAAATGFDSSELFIRYGLTPINYNGISAIHTLILDQCHQRGLPGLSLWGHCPAYVQGVTHYGLMIHLAQLLSDLVPVAIQTSPLVSKWSVLQKQIRQLIDEDLKLEGLVEEIRKKKRAGARKDPVQSDTRDGNVIRLEAFRG